MSVRGVASYQRTLPAPGKVYSRCPKTQVQWCLEPGHLAATPGNAPSLSQAATAVSLVLTKSLNIRTQNYKAEFYIAHTNGLRPNQGLVPSFKT